MSLQRFDKKLLKLEVKLPNGPPNRSILRFPAFVTAFSDNYTSNWKSEQAYGFQDQTGIFQGTSRKLTVSFQIIPNSMYEAAVYQRDLNLLIENLYPVFGINWTPKSSPLFGIKLSNLIQEANSFLFGWLDGFELRPEFADGIFDGGPHLLFPKHWSATFSLNVIHRKRPGYRQSGKTTAFSIDGQGQFPVKLPPWTWQVVNQADGTRRDPPQDLAPMPPPAPVKKTSKKIGRDKKKAAREAKNKPNKNTHKTGDTATQSLTGEQMYAALSPEEKANLDAEIHEEMMQSLKQHNPTLYYKMRPPAKTSAPTAADEKAMKAAEAYAEKVVYTAEAALGITTE